MLLKISLGLAILVGLGTLYITHFQVAPKVEEIRANLTQTQQDLATSRDEEAKAKTDAKNLRGQLDTTTGQLRDATNALATVTERATQQEERANKASADLETRTLERNEARQELAQWKTLGYDVEALRNRIALTDNLEKERNVLQDENKILNRKIVSLDHELDRYRGTREREVPLPAGTKGNIVAVDPKYDFVILDIGGNQGVLENAKMLVNRNGKLIGKVRITQVEANRSIANVIPEWKQDEIMEGDQVVF
jgi:DNA repair exonuclease SbcCD ATPase subunit